MLKNSLARAYSTYQVRFKNWRMFMGDKVMVNCGKDKGKAGKIINMNKKTNTLWVSGVNMKFQKTKAETQNEGKGGIRSWSGPLHLSRVNLVDPTTGYGTKVRWAFLSDGTKVRVSKKTGAIIPKPSRAHLTYMARHRHRVDGPLDTSVDKVLQVTYLGEDFDAIKRDFESYIAEKERIEQLLVFDK